MALSYQFWSVGFSKFIQLDMAMLIEKRITNHEMARGSNVTQTWSLRFLKWTFVQSTLLARLDEDDDGKVWN